MESPFATGFSWVLCGFESDLFSFLNTLAIGWSFILIFRSFKNLNDFSFMKAVGVGFVALVFALVILGVVLLVLALGAQLINFISDVLLEFKMNFGR